jgi:hypothetical protein
MNQRLKKYIIWFLTNGIIIAMLLSQSQGWVETSGFFDLAIILLWITAVIGCLFILPELANKVVEQTFEKGEGEIIFVNIYLTYILDISLGLYLAYINHPILAAVYLFHIVGLKNLYDARKNIFVDRLKQEPEANVS